MKRITLLAAVAAAIALMTSPVRAGRFEQYTAKYEKPPHPVREVVTAGYIGSGGTEWLAGVDFLADGSVVVAGTTLGPDMPSLCGTKVKVLGEDTPAPPAPSMGKDRRGRDVYPDWRGAGAAGFVAVLAPDGKSCRWAARLPWSSGSVTGAVADETGIYLVGLAGPKAAAIGEAKDVSAEPATDAGTAFVAKVSPTGDRVLWVRTFTDPGHGPTLRRTDDGRILAEGGWVYVFRPDGSLAEVAKVHKVKSWCRGVNPKTFGFACGWDQNTRTGREPWRQPHLLICPEAGPLDQPGGRKYYAWNSKLVGTDKYRLVSDSSIRRLYFGDDGYLYAVGWSDGGNTVFERLPESLDAPVPFKGLSFSTWGANVGSFAHLMKFKVAPDGKLELVNKTLWASYLRDKDKPNSCGISNLGVATDGSVLLVGGAGHHLIQTGDNLHANPDDISGPYVAILDGDFSSIRFSSIFTRTAGPEIRDGAKWGIAARTVGGRHLAAFVTSGLAEEAGTSAPQRNAAQRGFAGGLADGYLVLVDLGPAD